MKEMFLIPYRDNGSFEKVIVIANSIIDAILILKLADPEMNIINIGVSGEPLTDSDLMKMLNSNENVAFSNIIARSFKSDKTYKIIYNDNMKDNRIYTNIISYCNSKEGGSGNFVHSSEELAKVLIDLIHNTDDESSIIKILSEIKSVMEYRNIEIVII